jgi:signal transduction histidine kinase
LKTQIKILENINDETKLKQIIVNLITNALKFTDRGFVALAILLIKKKDV